MPKTRVTRKFQITIPKEIREKVKVKPGEIVNVESLSEEEIIIRRFRRVQEPLKVLIGRKPLDRHIPVEKLEEKAETR
jgi:AbrB family looped-hinge helix DNA binding protein